jgi:hypothetical protein
MREERASPARSSAAMAASQRFSSAVAGILSGGTVTIAQ